jgi:hypothetical protein
MKNSTFCLENINPTKNDFRLNYCIDNTYVYACALNSNKNIPVLPVIQPSANSTLTPAPTPDVVNPNEPRTGTFKITSSVVKGQGCQTTEFVPETECSSIGLVSCKDEKKCSAKCSYIECRKDATKPDTRVFGMCLPSKYTEDDIINRCKNHIYFSNYTLLDTTADTPTPAVPIPQIFRLNCAKKEAEVEILPNQSSHAFFKFLLIITGVLILSTFIISVYYRFKMSITGVPPFDPPAFVPNFILPRQTPYY